MAKDMYQKRKERQENKKSETYEEKKTNINWYPGHMAKTRRQIKETLKMVDIVLEVVDARIPYSSSLPDLKTLVNGKPVIKIFNKYDLCDKNITSKWINYYEKNSFICVPTDAKNSNDYKKIIIEMDNAFKSINKKRASIGLLNKKVNALIIGSPNVGKSTLINKFAGKKILETANKPGVTKQLRKIKINNDIDLIDTPGILWPKIENEKVSFNLACMGIIKEEVLPINEVSYYIIKTIYKNYNDKLKKVLKIEIEDINNIEKIYFDICKNNNIPIKNNDIDYEKVSLFILNLIKNEKISEITFDTI